MSTWFARNWPYLAIALVTAIVVHLGSVILLPHLIMNRLLGAMESHGGFNHMSYGARPTSAARQVVRPSPDLLYATCAYDLDKAGGGLHVHADHMPATYWSISIFDGNTDNFYVVNDRKAKDGVVDFTLGAPGGQAAGAVVHAPTARGILLVRTLINDSSRLAEIDAGRRHATCTPAS